MLLALSTEIGALDYTAILVALIAAISGIAAAYYQYSEKKAERGKRVKAEVNAASAGVSEAAMAKVADRALNLLEGALKSEKDSNENLTNLLMEARAREDSSSQTISRLSQELIEKANRIRELEHEVHSLRGRVDAILNRN